MDKQEFLTRLAQEVRRTLDTQLEPFREQILSLQDQLLDCQARLAELENRPASTPAKLARVR